MNNVMNRAEQERTEKVVSTFSDYINTMSYKAAIDRFVDLMARQHRTLQQSFTALCFAWLRKVASDDYSVDGRNEASQKAAKAIPSDLLDPPLPFV